MTFGTEAKEGACIVLEMFFSSSQESGITLDGQKHYQFEHSPCWRVEAS